MPRLSMNEMTTYRWSFEEDVAHYAAAGFTAIGVWRQKLSDYGEEKGIELLAECGLDVSNLLWAGGFTGSDGRSLRESINDAADAIRLAGELDCSTLVVYSGARAGHTLSHARRIVRDALVFLLPLAEEHGVNLALEPMHCECGAEWTFLYALEDTLAMISEIGHPLLKLTLDTYHLGWERDFLSRLESLAPRVAVVHLGDGHPPRNQEQNRCRLGEGEIPLKDIVARLSELGYNGYYDVELLGEAVESADYHDLLGQSKQAFADFLGLASKR